MAEITVKQGQEYLAREENIYERNIFFQGAYEQAATCLSEILKYSTEAMEMVGDVTGSSTSSLNRRLLQRSSNILSFCAGRGQGKTTAMVSFAKALREFSDSSTDWEYDDDRVRAKRDFWAGHVNEKTAFCVINSIDPTAMENQDSILKMVISRMFNLFQEACTTHNCCDKGTIYQRDDYEDRRNELALLFQQCYHNIEVLTASQKDPDYDLEDELERIADQGDSSNLRGALYKLICRYLDFVLPSGAYKQRFLVIQIDDADLNVDKAYSILEDIRKYLHLPGVVILMAANMRQLEVTVEQYFLREYKASLDAKSSLVDSEYCHHIAELYLEKLLPKPMRVYLPDLKLSAEALREGENGIKVFYERTKKEDGQERSRSREDLLSDGSSDPAWKYQNQLLHFLHRKTGLIFLAPQGYLHDLLPGTMRELTHFLAYFNQMEDVKADYSRLVQYCMNRFSQGDAPDADSLSDLRVWRKNLDLLERYLGRLWSTINLRKEGYFHFQTLMSRPQGEKHRYLLQILPDYYARERVEWERKQENTDPNRKEYRDLFLEGCKEQGVYIGKSLERELGEGHEHIYASYADVVTALNVLKDLPGGDQQYEFCYAVRLYYSIYAHELLLDYILQIRTDEQDSLLSQGLSVFFDDLLFRQGKHNSTAVPFAFWYLSADADALRRLFFRDVEVSESSSLGMDRSAFLQSNLRAEEQAPLYYTTRPIQLPVFALGQLRSPVDRNAVRIELNQLGRKTLFFNPFYSLWYDLRALLRGGVDEARSHREEQNADSVDEGIQQRYVLSLIVLLNWDVQDRLFHELKHPTSESQDDLYEGMQQLRLRMVALLNGNAVNNLAEIPLSSMEAGDFSWEMYRRLQLCLPAARDNLLVLYWQEATEAVAALEELDSALKESAPLSSEEGEEGEGETRARQDVDAKATGLAQQIDGTIYEFLRINGIMKDYISERDLHQFGPALRWFDDLDENRSNRRRISFLDSLLNYTRGEGSLLSIRKSIANAKEYLNSYSRLLGKYISPPEVPAGAPNLPDGADSPDLSQLKRDVLEEAQEVLRMIKDSLQNPARRKSSSGNVKESTDEKSGGARQ